ncbi:MAG: hypothetical protein GTO18_17270 [Anaerolineales bacterium]|nr:hypothetical protein [Anaerolineales bacterium]
MDTYSSDYAFSQNDLLERFLKRWYWPVGLGILGALVAFIFSLIVPPRYESAAILAVNIDYGRTEPLELVVEDRALDRVWALVTSDETLEEVTERLVEVYGESEDWGSVDALRKHIRLDGRLSRWELYGIHQNPELAASIANTWLEVTLSRLDEAMEHAWKAVAIQGAKFDVTCVNLLYGQPAEAQWNCIATGPDTPPEAIEELKAEIIASKGILPILSYEPIQQAVYPTQPVLWPRGLLIVAGALAGFIVGVVAALSLPLEKRSKADSNDPEA